MNISELMMKFLRYTLKFLFEVLYGAIDGATKAPATSKKEPEHYRWNWRTGKYDMGEDPIGWYDD